MESIAERIKELIDTLQISNTEFAKRTQLNPATVSHILNGRNKASLQVIENIKSEFTNVNIDYLITGNGSLFDDVTNVNTPITTGLDQGLFPMEGVRKVTIGGPPPSIPEKQVQDPLDSLKTKDIADSEPEIEDSKKISVSSSSENNTESEIDRIVIFYKNGSFKSYHP